MNNIEKMFIVTLFLICLIGFKLFEEFGVGIQVLGTLLIFMFGIALIDVQYGDKKQSLKKGDKK